MTDNEKAIEISSSLWSGDNMNGAVIRGTATMAALKMAEWKNKQSSNWHKVVDGDLPEKGGNYWCKLKGEYDQGSSHYKQHCNNGYCILQWLPKKKAWNVRYNTEVEAWIELPKYKEE